MDPVNVQVTCFIYSNIHNFKLCKWLSVAMILCPVTFLDLRED